MDVNFVLLLCIALIFAAHTSNKVDGEAQAFSSSITNSNLTETRFGGSEIVTNVTDSKSRRDHSKNTTQLGDGSKTKGSDSKSEGKEGVDEAISNSSKKIAKGFTVKNVILLTCVPMRKISLSLVSEFLVMMRLISHS